MKDLDRYRGPVSQGANALDSDLKWRIPEQPIPAPAPPARSWKRSHWLWALAALWAVALASLAYRTLRTPASSAAGGSEALGLRMERSGNDLVLSWDRDARAVQEARAGVFSVTDGGYRKGLDLDAAQLRQGRVMYTPQSGDVLFQLELITPRNGRVSESLRMLGDEPNLLAKGDVNVPVPTPPREDLRMREDPKIEERPIAPTRVARHVQPFIPPTPTRAAAPRVELPNPVVITPVDSSAQRSQLSAIVKPQLVLDPPSQPAVNPPARSATLNQIPVNRPVAQPPAVPVTQAPANRPVTQPSESVAAKPALGGGSPAIQVNRAGYVPPKATREVQPSVPQAMRAFVTRDVNVELLVSIDAAGTVSHVEPLSNGNAYLSKLAANAANLWRFQPATLNGKNVPSEMKLVFRFRGQ